MAERCTCWPDQADAGCPLHGIDGRFIGYPESASCEGDGYHDILDEDGGVVGPRPCRGCPDCPPEASS